MSRAEHLKNIVLPHELLEDLYSWHGGQGSAVYSLASTGQHHLVSRAMIARAIDELDGVVSSVKNRADRRNLKHLIGELDSIKTFWQEYSAKEHGIEPDNDGYDHLRD